MDRISVCEGYHLYYAAWHASGRTRRCERQGRSIAEQLHRMRFEPGPMLDLRSLAHDDRAEAREVYLALVERHEGAQAAADEDAWLEDQACGVGDGEW
jgi:hypothetical protein